MIWDALCMKGTVGIISSEPFFLNNIEEPVLILTLRACTFSIDFFPGFVEFDKIFMDLSGRNSENIVYENRIEYSYFYYLE